MSAWRIFIASSTKGQRYVDAIKSAIDDEMGASVCHPWRTHFEIGRSFLEDLERVGPEYNCGIAVFTADDQLGDLLAPRDNVVLELGLFLGFFGRERSFLLVENCKNIKIPSDYDGITNGRFYTCGPDASAQERRNAVHDVCGSVVDKLRRLEPPSPRPGALASLEQNWRKRRPGSDFELFSFYGLHRPQSPPSAQGEAVTGPCEDELYFEEDVYYLWADAARGGAIRAHVIPGDERVTEVQFDNAPGGFPGNVALRPNGKYLASAPSGRFATLSFFARVPDEQTAPVAFGLRVVDALTTHWEYCRRPHEYIQWKVKPGGGWTPFSIPLDDPQHWSVFAADGNWLYHDDEPDFSQVLAVVMEVGSVAAARPGAGKGCIQFKCLRAQ